NGRKALLQLAAYNPLHGTIMCFNGQVIHHLEREADRHGEGLRVLRKEGVIVPRAVAKPITGGSECKPRNEDHVEGDSVWFVARWMSCTVDAWHELVLAGVAVVFQHAALQGLRRVDSDAFFEQFIKQGIEINLRTHGQEAVQHAYVSFSDQVVQFTANGSTH